MCMLLLIANFGGLLGRGSLSTASEVTSATRIELSDLSSLLNWILLGGIYHHRELFPRQEKWLPLTSVREAQHAGKKMEKETKI